MRIFFILVGGGMSIWIGLQIAPVLSEGLVSFLEHPPQLFAHPFHIEFCKQTFPCICFCFLLYGLCVMGLKEMQKGTNHESHGSAQWGEYSAINKKYRDKKGNNMVLTKHVFLGRNSHAHKRNLNVLVCGGSGSGKTRFYVKPNILNSNGNSLVITDPNGYNLGG